MILIDTSAWIDHWRKENRRVRSLLEDVERERLYGRGLLVSARLPP